MFNLFKKECRHKWDKWEIWKVWQIESHYHFGRPSSSGQISGETIIQQRRCSICGFTEFRKKDLQV